MIYILVFSHQGKLENVIRELFAGENITFNKLQGMINHFVLLFIYNLLLDDLIYYLIEIKYSQQCEKRSTDCQSPHRNMFGIRYLDSLS